MAPLHYAAKFDPFLSLDCAPTPPPWRNPRKGRDQILPSGNLGIAPPSQRRTRTTLLCETVLVKWSFVREKEWRKRGTWAHRASERASTSLARTTTNLPLDWLRVQSSPSVRGQKDVFNTDLVLLIYNTKISLKLRLSLDYPIPFQPEDMTLDPPNINKTSISGALI